MSKKIVELRESIVLIEKNKMTVEQAIDEIVPRAFAALEKCESAEQVNELRDQIQTVHTYIKRKLPADRRKRLKNNNKWAMAYIMASRTAGALWRNTEHYKGRPPEDNSDGNTAFTAQELGFADRWDARKCEKASLVNEQDFELYLKECNENQKQATLTGVVGIYDLLNPKTVGGKKIGKEVSFSTRPLYKRLNDTADKLCEWRDETEGDSSELITKAVLALMDAAEIEKDNAPET